MLQFQNCAPVDPASMQAETSGEARIVDDWGSEKIAFVEPNLEVQEEVNSTYVYGFCQRSNSGEVYDWKVLTPGEGVDVIEIGEAQCEGGGFRIQVSSLKELDCQSDYKILVETEAGQQDLMFLRRNCSL